MRSAIVSQRRPPGTAELGHSNITSTGLGVVTLPSGLARNASNEGAGGRAEQAAAGGPMPDGQRQAAELGSGNGQLHVTTPGHMRPTIGFPEGPPDKAELGQSKPTHTGSGILPLTSGLTAKQATKGGGGRQAVEFGAGHGQFCTTTFFQHAFRNRSHPAWPNWVM